MNNNNIENLKKQTESLINLYNSKRFEEVIQKGRVLIKKFPNQLLFYNATSLALSAIGRNEEALKILKDAINIQSNNIFVLNNLGLINGNLNNNELSRDYYDKALSIKEDFIDALVNLSNLNLKENRTDEAKICLDKALAASKHPQTDLVIYGALGQYYQHLGNFKEAINSFNIVNKINPINVIADKGISLIHKYKDKNDPHIKLMEEKLNKIKDEENLQHLYFALGKAYEDLKDYKKSFNYLELGNRLADKKFKYNILEQERLFDNIIKVFNKYDNKILQNISPNLIFIVGMPRSGTTLTEQILSSHKKVYGAGELSFLEKAITEDLMENGKFISNDIKNFDDNKLLSIQKKFLKGIKLFNYKEDYLIDKAPLNFRWIGFIKIIFPKSKIIHCKRDPLDICFSNFKNNFSSKSIGFSYNLDKLGNYYNLYTKLMKFWKEKFENEIFDLSYEELISDQEKITKKLLDFCNLEWDENCLRPHKNKKSVSTASLAQVRSPVYKSSVNKWENYKEQLEKLKKIITDN